MNPIVQGNMSITGKTTRIVVGLIMAVTVGLPAIAPAVDVSQDPLSFRLNPPAPNAMFVIDNSGSMDWEMMAPDTNGLMPAPSIHSFDGFGYVFENAGDNNYATGTYSYTIEDYDPGLWKSQWSGYNRMFFNQHVTYNPWPGKPPVFSITVDETDSANPIPQPVSPSSLTQVLSNPHYPSGAAFDLTATFQTLTGGEVIVDNLAANNSGGSTFTILSASWTESGSPNEWAGSSYYTGTTNGSVQWTPKIPTSGSYDVYAWWNSYSGRDQAAEFTIAHSGGTTVYQRDQSANGGQWVLLGSHSFNQGYNAGTGSVTLRRTGSSGDSTLADAVRFVKTGSEVNISRAHYYTIDDQDDDGELDSGESIYLVNFVHNGSVWTREYYIFNDSDGDDRVESGELTPVSVPPDSIKPAIYDDNGDLISYKTTDEDLQNLANWYSFHRRRELTAKGAIGTAISRVKNVNVGFYTINDGARQGVLPVKVPGQLDNFVIVDDRDSGFSRHSSFDGPFNSNSNNRAYGDRYYRTGSNDNSPVWARFRPDIPSAGAYDVYAWWTCQSDNSRDTLYVINNATPVSPSTSTVVKDQRLNDPDAGNPCGDWVYIGTYTFQEGNSGYVQVSDNNNNGGRVVADAMKFESTTPAGTIIFDETDALLNLLYSINSSGGTPLRQALYEVGSYYDQNDGNSITWGSNSFSSPYASSDDGGQCQLSFAIAMTDGYWNGTLSDTVGNVDGSTSTCPEGSSGGAICSGYSPWSDGYSNTLADIAMRFYKRDLVGGLDNVVPTDQCDIADWQHMVTYAVSFGVPGSPGAENIGQCPTQGTVVPWLKPTLGDGPEKIDDLRHASVNARGGFFSAGDPEQLVNGLVEILQAVESKAGSGSSVTANGENLTGDTTVYQARFNTLDWSGDLIAMDIDPATGTVCNPNRTFDPTSYCGQRTNPVWSADEELQAYLAVSGSHVGRRVVTFNPDPVSTFGIPFRLPTATSAGDAGLTAAQLATLDPAIDPASLATSNMALAGELIDYLRGLEVGGFRQRGGALPDLVHSAPVLYKLKVEEPLNSGTFVDKGTLFVGGNGGMLHAFDMDTGKERFAYVPDLVFSNLADLADPAYGHKFYVDNSPSIRAIPTPGSPLVIEKVILVGALGAGGKGYFALDIKNAHTVVPPDPSIPETFPEAAVRNFVMWEFPRTGTNLPTAPADVDDIGLSFSRAFVVKAKINSTIKTNLSINTDGWVVIFGNGYNSNNGDAVLFVLDAYSGKLISKINTGAIGDNGLSTPTLVDPNNDGFVDYVYAGDLQGNMWKFDLTSDDPASWAVAFDDGTNPQPLFRAGADRPITTKPSVMYHCSRHGYMVVFGTGKFIGEVDRTLATPPEEHSIFGIWDFADDSENTFYVGELADRDTGALTNTFSTQTPAFTTYLRRQEEIFYNENISGNIVRVLSNYPVNYYVASDSDKPSTELPDPANNLSSYLLDKIDNDRDGTADPNDSGGAPPDTGQDENRTHLGWYFDFPNTAEKFYGERVIVDPLIRSGKAIVTSFAPLDSECSGGGWSMVHEMDACTGGYLLEPVFDISGDYNITSNLYNDTTNPGDAVMTITINGQNYNIGATGLGFVGLLQPPKILRLTELGKPWREVKLFNSETATMTSVIEKAEKRGMIYWKEN